MAVFMFAQLKSTLNFVEFNFKKLLAFKNKLFYVDAWNDSLFWSISEYAHSELFLVMRYVVP